eukprot:gene1308-12464_t
MSVSMMDDSNVAKGWLRDVRDTPSDSESDEDQDSMPRVLRRMPEISGP